MTPAENPADELAPRPKVFIVEDDFLIREYLCEMASDIGLDVVGTADRADEAASDILRHRPAFVFMDLRLRGTEDGVDAAHLVQAGLPETKIIYITGSSEPASLERIATDHPHRVLIKPISERELRRAVGMPSV